jgi:hypothetical protein
MCKAANLHCFHTVTMFGVLALDLRVLALGSCTPELRAEKYLFISDKPRSGVTDRLSHPPEENTDCLRDLVRLQI